MTKSKSDKSSSNKNILKPSKDGSYKFPSKTGISLALKLLDTSSIFDNSLGHYFENSKGIPISGCIDIPSIQNAKEKGEELIIKYEHKNIPKGASKLGFFLVPNGANLNQIKSGDIVTFKEVAGIWSIFVSDKEVQGASMSAFFSNIKMNFDSIAHMKHLPNNVIGWNDRFSEDDDEFDDITLNTTICSGTDITIDEQDNNKKTAKSVKNTEEKSPENKSPDTDSLREKIVDSIKKAKDMDINPEEENTLVTDDDKSVDKPAETMSKDNAQAATITPKQDKPPIDTKDVTQDQNELIKKTKKAEEALIQSSPKPQSLSPESYDEEDDWARVISEV